MSPTQRALNVWAVILIVWAFYRSYLKMPIWFDEFVAKPIVFVLPVFYYVIKVDKKNIFEYFFFKTKFSDLVKDFFYGLGFSVLFLITSMAASYFRSGKFVFLGEFPSAPDFFYIVILALATGITEEILSRGFVLRKLYEESKNVLSSTFFASVLFFFLHVPILFANAKITGNMLLIFMITDLLLSMVNGLIFLQRRSLLVPIFIHAFYNIVVALSFI